VEKGFYYIIDRFYCIACVLFFTALWSSTNSCDYS